MEFGDLVLHLAGPRAGRFRAAADSAGPLYGKGSSPDVRGRTAGRAGEKSVKPRWLLSQEMVGGGGTQGQMRFLGIDFLSVPPGAGVCGAVFAGERRMVSTSVGVHGINSGGPPTGVSEMPW